MTTNAQHRAHILRLLKSHHPMALGPASLGAVTPRYSARIGELRRDGWEIETIRGMRGRQAGYRLVSLAKGTPDETLAGCVLRLGSEAGWEARSHQDASYPSDVLSAAQEAALAAYRGVIAQHEATVEAELDWFDRWLDEAG